MAATLAELLVKIKTDKDQAAKDIKGLRSEIDKTDKQSSKFAKSFSSSFKSLVNPTTILLGSVVALTAGIKSAIQAAGEQERVVSQLNAVIKSTGGVAGITSKAAQDLARSLQQVTTYGDEVIIPAETILLTFTKIGKDVFPKATEIILDMSEVLGQDLKSSAIQLGKALNDPIQGVTALRRVGVQLSAEQENQIKQFVNLGQIAEAQKVILGELSTQMGGAARATAETYSGRIKQLSNAFGDLKETIGNLFIGKGGEGIVGLTQFVTDISNAIVTVQKKYIQLALFLNDINKKLAFNENLKKQALIREYELRKRYIDLMGDEEEKTDKKTFQQKKTITDEEIKLKQKQAETIAKINADLENKLVQQTGDRLAIINSEEYNAFQQVNALTQASDEKKEKARTQIATYYAEQRKQLEIQKAQEAATAVLGVLSSLTGQLSGILNQYITNRQINLDNQQTREQERIDAEYEARKEELESTITDEEELAEALKALDEKKARDTELLNEKMDKKKRKLAREAAKKQKQLAIAETLIAIPQAAFQAYKALAGIPIVGPALGAIAAAAATALGLAKLALIRQQPLPEAAQGGIFASPYIGGEAGKEMAVPLESENGRNAIRELAKGMLDVMSQQANTNARVGQSEQQSVSESVVYLDGEKVGRWITKGSANGLFTLNPRVVVT